MPEIKSELFPLKELKDEDNKYSIYDKGFTDGRKWVWIVIGIMAIIFFAEICSFLIMINTIN